MKFKTIAAATLAVATMLELCIPGQGFSILLPPVRKQSFFIFIIHHERAVYKQHLRHKRKRNAYFSAFPPGKGVPV